MENEYISALKKYAIFKGRSTRKEYWMFILYNLIFTILIGIVDGVFVKSQGVISNIYSLIIFYHQLLWVFAGCMMSTKVAGGYSFL